MTISTELHIGPKNFIEKKKILSVDYGATFEDVSCSTSVSSRSSEHRHLACAVCVCVVYVRLYGAWNPDQSQTYIIDL